MSAPPEQRPGKAQLAAFPHNILFPRRQCRVRRREVSEERLALVNIGVDSRVHFQVALQRLCVDAVKKPEECGFRHAPTLLVIRASLVFRVGQRYCEYRGRRHRVKVAVVVVNIQQMLVAGQIRCQPRLDLAVVKLYEAAAISGDNEIADADVIRAGSWHILEVWVPGREAPALRAEGQKLRVDAARHFVDAPAVAINVC